MPKPDPKPPGPDPTGDPGDPLPRAGINDALAGMDMEKLGLMVVGIMSFCVSWVGPPIALMNACVLYQKLSKNPGAVADVHETHMDFHSRQNKR